MEVLGLVLIALAVLLTLAIVSYNPSDDPLARAFTPRSTFNPAIPPVANIMGLLGAYLSWLLVPNFLGYPVIGISILGLVFGWSVFRTRPLKGYIRWSLLALAAVFVAATFAGWLAPAGAPTLWSGALGSWISGILTRAIGSIGALIVLIACTAILIRLSFDGDLQDSIDKVGGHGPKALDWVRNAGATMKSWIPERTIEPEAAASRKQRSATAQDSGPHSPEFARSPEGDERPRSRPTVNDQFKGRAQPATLMGDGDASASDQVSVSAGSSGQEAAKPTAETPDPADEAAPDLSIHVRERVEEDKVNLDERAKEAVPTSIRYEYPSVELLDDDSDSRPKVDYEELEENKQILLDKLGTYNIEITNIEAVVGPTVTLYELTPAPGVKISRIKSLEDDLAMAMAARGIRMIAPIPGKSAIGVEIPNRYRELVQVSSVLNTARFRDAKMSLPVALGKTIEGEVYVEDLAKMPHLLIAGATGSGKSVGLNNLIANLLYACHPADLKFVMIDPKRIELQQYARIFDHFIAMPEGNENPITTDFNEAAGVLHSCLKEMELRYDLLSDAGVRTIKEYNKRVDDGRINKESDVGHKHLPYIVVVVDELADLMMTAGKEVEGPIARLAQMARAVGIHLVVATQRPSVNVITGLIKANFPSRVAFQVASGVDSRTIIDHYGAEQLVGNGDLLYMAGSRLIRLQSPFISLDEIEAITQFIAAQQGGGPYVLPKIERESEDEIGGFDESDLDPLFKDAARAIVRSQQGSVSLLQRKLSVGYARAARIVDQLESAGIVGPFEGSKARQVLVPDEIQLDQFFKEGQEESI